MRLEFRKKYLTKLLHDMYDIHLEIRKMNGLCFIHTKRFFRKIFKMETSSIIKIFVFLLNFLV